MDFFCQNPRCRKPLEIDESLFQIDLELLKSGSIEEIEDFLKEAPYKSPKAEGEPLPPLSNIAALFEFASDQTGWELPQCPECLGKLLKSVSQKAQEAIHEYSAYRGALRSLEAQADPYPPEWQLQEEITRLEEEAAALQLEEEVLLEERRALEGVKKRLAHQADRLSGLEGDYWLHFAAFQEEAHQFQEENAAVRMKLRNAGEWLETLKATDVYNDTFHIWHDGHFGTINNFRLGRLPSQPVDWNEINAAWGQTTLLLFTLAKKMNFTFSQFRLLPMGSYSKMERISDQSTYELYGSSDISLGRLFWYRRFDNGMVAFLGCVKEFADAAESRDKNFKTPYRIEKDKIGEMSIKIQFNNEETWTKALKYMLTNLKFLLVWVAKEST